MKYCSNTSVTLSTHLSQWKVIRIPVIFQREPKAKLRVPRYLLISQTLDLCYPFKRSNYLIFMIRKSDRASYAYNKSLSSRIQTRGRCSFRERCSATRSTTCIQLPEHHTYVIQWHVVFRPRFRFRYLASSTPNHAIYRSRKGGTST